MQLSMLQLQQITWTNVRSASLFPFYCLILLHKVIEQAYAEVVKKFIIFMLLDWAYGSDLP